MIASRGSEGSTPFFTCFRFQGPPIFLGLRFLLPRLHHSAVFFAAAVECHSSHTDTCDCVYAHPDNRGCAPHLKTLRLTPICQVPFCRGRNKFWELGIDLFEAHSSTYHTLYPLAHQNSCPSHMQNVCTPTSLKVCTHDSTKSSPKSHLSPAQKTQTS